MKAIACISNNYGLGKSNELLFSIPADMKFFKETTTGNIVVMGRKTFESLPGQKPLPNRFNIVLSRDKEFKAEGVKIVSSVAELFDEISKKPGRDVFIIGGASLYNDMRPYIDEFFLTKVYEDTDADVFLFNIDEDENFKLVSSSDEFEYENHKFRFLTYKRTN